MRGNPENDDLSVE